VLKWSLYPRCHTDYCTLDPVQSPYFMINIFGENKSAFAYFVLFGTVYVLLMNSKKT
jgi:hypothetical protein